MIRSIALALLILTGACASAPGDKASRELAKKPLRGVVAAFQTTSYDGETIRGRVLLGATLDPLVMYAHLLESGDLELSNLRACGKPGWIPHVIFDMVISSTDADDVITIRPGYWYGKNVTYGLFIEKETGLGPACLEAELVVQASDGRVAARLPIRVVRTDKPSTQPDGGTEAPKPPASDAGAP